MGKTKFEEMENVTVMKSADELLIVGTPDEDDETHNCDAMGCTAIDHVLYRFNI